MQKTQEVAVSFGQSQVDVFHFLAAMIDQEGSIVKVILEKFDVNLEKIKQDLRENIEKYPKAKQVQVGQIS